MAKKSSLTYEEQLRKYKKTRLVLRLLILFLLLLLIFLFYFKKNLLLTKFELKGDKEINIKQGEKYKDDGFVAKIFNKDLSSYVKVKDNVNYDKIGYYKIIYTLKVPVLNIDDKIIRKVNIIDNIAPELKIDSSDTVYININEKYTMPKYEAIDNLDGDITKKVKVEGEVNSSEEGEYIIKYVVTDSSNNSTSHDIKVVVEEKYKHAYIRVTKSTQTLDYYEGDKLVFTSPVVTGNDIDTPLGEFEVNNKLPTARLVGPNNEWDSTVNWWIAFIGISHGFHDSSWRNAFGGDIWLYNPTHGCINLPKDKAKELYDLVEIGTKVYIVE